MQRCLGKSGVILRIGSGERERMGKRSIQFVTNKIHLTRREAAIGGTAAAAEWHCVSDWGETTPLLAAKLHR